MSLIAFGGLLQAAAGGGGGPSGEAWKRSITIDHTKVGSTNTANFRLLVSVSLASLKTVANGGEVQSASGYDIIFYDDAALTTVLDWEIESWNGSTGDLVAWVRVPSVSTSTDTVIYLAYGSTLITTDQSNKTGVWGANAQSVLHLGDGSTLSVADSSTRNETWTTNGPPGAGTGKIRGGMVVSGAHEIHSGSGLPDVSVPDFTARVWFKPSALSATNGIMSGNSDITNPGFLAQVAGTNLKFYVNGAYRETSQNLSVGTWYLIALTVSSAGPSPYTTGATDWKFYLNGALLSTYSTTGGRTFFGLPPIYVGNGYNGQAPGTYDEARFIAEAASPDQMLAEYNNENDPSTFYSVGSEVAA